MADERVTKSDVLDALKFFKDDADTRYLNSFFNLKLGGVESDTEGVMWVESATQLGVSTFALGTALDKAEGAIFIDGTGSRYSSLPILIGTNSETAEGAIWVEV